MASLWDESGFQIVICFVRISGFLRGVLPLDRVPVWWSLGLLRYLYFVSFGGCVALSPLWVCVLRNLWLGSVVCLGCVSCATLL